MTPAMARRWGRYVALGAGMIFMIFPLYWMIHTAFTPRAALFRPPYKLVRTDYSLENVRELLIQTDFTSFMANSLIVAAGAVMLNVIAATLAGYGLSRFRFPLRRTFVAATLWTYMFPPILLAIPLFVLFSRLGLRGELPALIVIYLASTVPVSVYMLRNYFRSIPKGLEDAAMVAGCNRVQVIVRIVLPLAMPAIAATSLYVFMIAWNEYLFALLFLLESRDNWTVSLGLAQLDDISVSATVLMAGSVLLTLPVIALFFAAERLLVEGLTAGAEKG